MFIVTRSLSCHILRVFKSSKKFFLTLNVKTRDLFKKGCINLFTLSSGGPLWACPGFSPAALSRVSSLAVVCRLLLAVALSFGSTLSRAHKLQ